MGRSPYQLVDRALPVDQQRVLRSGRRPVLRARRASFGCVGEKRSAPVALRPRPLRRPGRLQWEGPSTTGRSLGVSLNSTYIARRARGHGGRCRVIGPVAGCPAPFPSRRNPSHPTRTNPDRLRRPTREDLGSGGHSMAEARWCSPSSKTLADEVGLRRTGGSPHQQCRRLLAPRQAGSPVGDDWVVVVPCTDSAGASLIEAVLRQAPEGT